MRFYPDSRPWDYKSTKHHPLSVQWAVACWRVVAEDCWLGSWPAGHRPQPPTLRRALPSPFSSRRQSRGRWPYYAQPQALLTEPRASLADVCPRYKAQAHQESLNAAKAPRNPYDPCRAVQWPHHNIAGHRQTFRAPNRYYQA